MNEVFGGATLVLLSFVACGDGGRSGQDSSSRDAASAPTAPPAPSASAIAVGAGHSDRAPIVARRLTKLPEIVDPDPMTLTPLPRALDSRIECATPRVPGRRLPKGASPRVRGLYEACARAIETAAKEPPRKPFQEKDDPIEATWITVDSPPPGLRACTVLARVLDRGFGAPENAILAASLDARACGLGDLEACTGLAAASLSGHGNAFDPECGGAVLAWACDEGGALACERLGVLAMRGELVPFDPKGAEQLFARACEGGAHRGCLSLADTVESTDAPRALELEGRAETLAASSCRGGDGGACADLAWFHNPHSDGNPFSKAYAATHRDPSKLAGLRRMACFLDSRSGCSGDVPVLEEACKGGNFERCIDAAFEHVNAGGMGDGFSPSDHKVLEEACLGGSSRGCWALGDRHSESLFEDACKGGELSACRSGPREHVIVPSSPDLRKKACDQGSAIDCRELGEKAAKLSMIPEAMRLFEKACPAFRSRLDYRDIDAIACAAAGRRYRKGDGVTRDPERAVELLQTGCYAEGRMNPRGEGCQELAEMYDSGDGVPRDRDRATDLLAGICYARHEGCDELALRLPNGRP